MDKQHSKLNALGRLKRPGGWKVMFIEYREFHSQGQGKENQTREGLRFPHQKKYAKPFIGK